MFFIIQLLEWFGCHTQRFIPEHGYRGIGFFGVEPSSPQPPRPAAPPIRPCPYDRDTSGLERPSF